MPTTTWISKRKANERGLRRRLDGGIKAQARERSCAKKREAQAAHLYVAHRVCELRRLPAHALVEKAQRRGVVHCARRRRSRLCHGACCERRERTVGTRRTATHVSCTRATPIRDREARCG